MQMLSSEKDMEDKWIEILWLKNFSLWQHANDHGCVRETWQSHGHLSAIEA